MDNRIHFSPGRIDFNVVGLTGQDHDDYPKPGQARYDWMRIYLIGLLSNQSSEEEPNQRRPGSLWFNLKENFFRYFDGDNFEPLAKGIKMTYAGQTLSLWEWMEKINEEREKEVISSSFSGVSTSSIITLPIPLKHQKYAQQTNSHPFLSRNGLMVDPHFTSYTEDRKNISLSNEAALQPGDKYIVMIQRLDELL